MSFVKTPIGLPILKVIQVAPGALKGADGSPVLAMSVYAAKPADGRNLVGGSEVISEGGPTFYIDASFANGVTITPDGRPVLALYVTDAVGAPGFLGGSAGLSSTNATLTTAAGADPQVDLTFGADIYPGFYLRIQRSATGTKDGSNNYTVPTMDILHTVTETERFNLAIPNANLAPDGYFSPAGAWWQRYRWEREDGVYGPWTELNGTVTTSTAVLTSANGTSKNANIAVTGTPKLLFAGSGGVGAFCSVRATIEAQSDFTQWEMTITQFGASDFVYAGFCNLTDSFVGFVGPGSTSSNGVIFKIQANNVFINWNTDANGATLSTATGVAALNDTFALVLKKSTNQLSLYRTRAGVTVQIGTTQTIPAFAAYYAFVSTRQGWNGTVNFGASAFARAFASTETYYG